MKAVFNRTFITLAGIVLVVPFVTVSLLVGARAVAGAESAEQRLLLVLLAVGGAVFSGTNGFARRAREGREDNSLRNARVGVRRQGRAFLRTHVY